MKVRLCECGVTSGIGSRPAARRSALANLAAASKERLRTFEGLSRLPAPVEKTNSPGRVYKAAGPVLGEQFLQRRSQIDLANACVSLRRRDPRKRRASRFTSRQRRSSASLIRRPASVRVASSGRRRRVSPPRASASIFPTALSSAAT